jgi:hypothetical protein
MIDDRPNPTTINFGYSVESGIDLRWGEGRSTGYGEPVVGSFADITVKDPENRFQQFFGTEFDELSFKALIEGSVEGHQFQWKGRVQQSQFDRPVSPRVQSERKTIRLYDRLGALKDKNPIPRPEILDVEEFLMRTLFPAQPNVDILYDIDVEGASYFDGSPVPPQEWYPTTRRPATRDVGDTDDVDDEGIGGGSLREQLETFAGRLGLKVWQEPFTGTFHVVPRFRVGEEITDATRITSNGYPLDDSATPSFDRSATIPQLLVQDPPLRAENQDRYQSVEGVKKVTVEIENSPLLKNPHFKLYEFVNSRTGSLEDFTADFLFWEQAENPYFAQKMQVLWPYNNRVWRSEEEANDYVGLNVVEDDNQLSLLRQQTRPVSRQDFPVTARLLYRAVPIDPNAQKNDGYVFNLILEHVRDDGTTSRVETEEITPTFFGAGLEPATIPDEKFIETPASREAGQYRVTVSGNNIWFKVVGFELTVQNPSGDNLLLSSIDITPTDNEKGRKEVQISDDTFYFNGELNRLKNPLGRTQFIENWEKETQPTVQPIDWSSPRLGRNYDNLYKYRAVARLAQQPPGTDALQTLVVPGILTPGRAIDIQDEGRLIFAGGRTVHLTGEETGTTELNDIVVPEVLSDPIDPGARPEAPDILLTSFATYDLTAQDASRIEGYKLSRRNAPDAPETEVEQAASQNSPESVADPNPAPGMNLHVARTYNSNGDSPPSREALQLPSGWYKDGDPEFSPNPIPSPSAGASNAALIDGEMYIFGGIDGSGRHARCYKYDVWADTWTQLPNYPEGPTEGLFAAASPPNGGIIVGGGIGPGGARPGTHFWNRSVPEWQPLDNLPEPIGYGAVARGRGSGNYEILIAHGGEDGAGAATSAVQRLNLNSGAWATLSDAPFSERRHGAVYRQSDDLWYVFGGAEDRSRLWQFNARQDAWSSVGSAPPTPVSEYGIAYSSAQDSAFLIGGTPSGGGQAEQPQEYSFSAGAWTEHAGMPTPRSEARGVFIDGFDVLFAVGGDGGSPTGINEVYVLGLNLKKSGSEPTWTSCQDYTVDEPLTEENAPTWTSCQNYTVTAETANTAPQWTSCQDYTTSE